MMQPGTWHYSPEHQQQVQIIDQQTLWGRVMVRVWLPQAGQLIQLPAENLQPLQPTQTVSPAHLTYMAAAGRILHSLTDSQTLLAPLSASVIPLPHQIRALQQSMAQPQQRVRYLLADEVGLGKTIEAGLVMKELKLRGFINRILIVAPTGLVTQWVMELQTHFGETFQLLLPSDFPAYRRLHTIPDEANIWANYNQVICPLDSVKPMEQRRGWTREQISTYNRERFDGLVSAGWDLVIFDESHRLGGSSDQVARYQLGEALAEVTPHLLLLSATPHQGKTDSFRRLMALLDPHTFPDEESVTHQRVQPYLIRTPKPMAIDALGQPLFKPRQTRLISIDWLARHAGQQQLYETVTDYVREGYNQAMQEKKTHLGFLMVLLQRLVTSSTRAIRVTLQRRLAQLTHTEEALRFPPSVDPSAQQTNFWGDELDAQTQLELLLEAQLTALQNEQSEVEALLAQAKQTEANAPDAKAEALLEWLYRLQREETDPDLKLLIFTEFVPTQAMLFDFLTERGISAVCLNGSLSIEERKQVQQQFAGPIRVLISTDAGGEGLNLQFCHVIINYDIPWNPMRLEQRIGRVDRIGQPHVVRALNFVLADTVEHRVQEVLTEKLQTILQEFGVDKTSDVLDSAEAEKLFDDLFVAALQNPDELADTIDTVVQSVQTHATAQQQSQQLLTNNQPLDPHAAKQVLEHPLTGWLKQFTLNYLAAQGGQATQLDTGWQLHWPDGQIDAPIVFTPQSARQQPTAQQLLLDDPHIYPLLNNLPPFVTGQPIPRLTLAELPAQLQGIWSLWQIKLLARTQPRQTIMPLFMRADDGRIFKPTALYVWDQLLSGQFTMQNSPIDPTHFEQVQIIAQEQGQQIYQTMHQQHQQWLVQEQEKREYAFTARRKALERIGLRSVRSHRIYLLERERQLWREELQADSQAMPELIPLLVVWVESGKT